MTAVEIGEIAGILMVVVCAFIAAQKASNQGKSYPLHFFIGLIFGPLWILVLYLRTPRKKQCHFCKEKIHIDAIFCKHCHKDQPAVMETQKNPKSHPRTTMVTRKDGSFIYVSKKDAEERSKEIYNLEWTPEKQ
jgi:hypothetical protein